MSKHKAASPPPLPDPLSLEGAEALRRAAEAVYHEQGQGRPPAGTRAGAATDEARLIEELHIHQIELELQNQSLRATRLQLEASLNRYGALYNFAPIALLTLRDDGAILEANQTAGDLLGRPLSGLLGRRLGIFVGMATRAAFNELLSEALLGEAGARRELVLMSPDLAVRWVQAEGISAVTPVDSKPQIQLALTDISASKALAASLQEQEALFRAILENSSDGISYLDLKTHGYRFINSALLTLSGFTTEDMLHGITAQQIYDHIHPDDREKVEAERRRVALGQKPETIQYRWRGRQGEYRWLIDSGKFVYDAQGQAVGLINARRDITRVKQHDLEIQALNASLEQKVLERTAELAAKIAELEGVTAALRVSEEEARRHLVDFDAIYAAAPVGLAVLDAELRYRRINDRLATRNGYPAADHLGRGLREMVPVVADRVEPLLRQVIATGQPLQFELSGDTNAHPGERHIWQENAYPLKAPDGQVIGLNLVVEDVTSRRQAEDNLRASERRFRELFEHLPIPYQSVDGEGRWLDANQKMADLLGFAKPEEMIGLSFVDFWDPAIRDRFEGNFACFKKELKVDGELQLRRRDGAPLSVLIAGRIQCDDQGRFQRTHCILVDISERRAMEDEVRALNDTLERKVAERTAEARAASAAKSEFLAHMSHEIRTPLNAILGHAQLLERGHLDGTQHQQVARLQEAGENLLAILNDILDFSKIEAGRLAIEIQPFDLRNLVARCESLHGRQAHAKGLRLRIDGPALPTGALLGDPLRLAQVLDNLLGNAIKFTAAGEVRLRVSIREPGAALATDEGQTTVRLPATGAGLTTAADTVTRAEDGASAGSPRLRFEVVDSGIGIEPEVLASLFRPFTQGDASITRRFGGTGLGLAISKRLVELMGGEIGATSQPGRGSTFWFELPFSLTRQGAPLSGVAPGEPTLGGMASNEPALGGTQARTPTTYPRLAGWHLLVVDDSEMNREVVEQALCLEGAEVTLAPDGAEALDRLRHQPQAYQAVLMDVQMPVMDGLTAARRIRAELGLIDLPLIALTAGALPHEREAALAAGMNDVLTKPVRLEGMVAMIQQYAATPGRVDPQAPASAEAFPAIAGIDRDLAMEILCGNRTMFLRLLGLFLAEGAGLVRRVRGELAQGQREAAARRLHNLRGNAGSLGAKAIMAQARRLEEAIDGGETDLNADLTELDLQLQNLCLASAPWSEVTQGAPDAPRLP